MLKIPGFRGKFREPDAASAAVSVQPTSGVAVKKEVKVPLSRPASSFKIKDSFRQLSQVHPPVSQTPATQRQVGAHEPLDEDKVVAAFKKYTEERHTGVTMEVALTSHRPLLAGDRITVFADNRLQLKELEAIKTDLLHFLTDCLNNGFIVCEFALFDSGSTKEEKKLFTVGEKFEHFVEINPVVADLKRIFGLELE